jgi:hypothetical protein
MYMDIYSERVYILSIHNRERFDLKGPWVRVRGSGLEGKD